LGKNECKDEGKVCQTKITKICYSLLLNESLVLCEPLTGRTHQIRLHLQFFGFPISNDPIYANLIQNKITENKIMENNEPLIFDPSILEQEENEENEEQEEKKNQNDNSNENKQSLNVFDLISFSKDKDCIHCAEPNRDPIPTSIACLWLHSFCYIVKNNKEKNSKNRNKTKEEETNDEEEKTKFSTLFPGWAKEVWQNSQQFEPLFEPLKDFFSLKKESSKEEQEEKEKEHLKEEEKEKTFVDLFLSKL
jgi:hypothetical protein